MASWEDYFNPLPQAQQEQQNFMNNYSAGQYNNSQNTINGLNPNGASEINNWMNNQAPNYGYGSSNQGGRYNTDQGMNRDPWGQWDNSNQFNNWTQQQSQPASTLGITGPINWNTPKTVDDMWGEYMGMRNDPNSSKNPALERLIQLGYGPQGAAGAGSSSYNPGDLNDWWGEYMGMRNDPNSSKNPALEKLIELGYGPGGANVGNQGGGITENNRGLPMYGGAARPQIGAGAGYGNQGGGGVTETGQGGLPMFGGGRAPSYQQPQSFGGGNPYGGGQQQGGLFDYNDRAQQDAFVRSLGANAPAIFGDNGHMSGQDWANRWDAIRQVAMGRPVESFGAPAQPAGPGNYYGRGGAQGFNELGGELAQNSDRFNEAFGKFGWNLVTPTGGSQDQAESIARAMAARDPNTDYEPVNMGGGQWNIATRSRLPGGGQPFSGLLPRPAMPAPNVAQAPQRYAAPTRNYSGGGGGSNYRPANQPAARPQIAPQVTQNFFANALRAVPGLLQGAKMAKPGEIVNTPFGGRGVIDANGHFVPLTNKSGNRSY